VKLFHIHTDRLLHPNFGVIVLD